MVKIQIDPKTHAKIRITVKAGAATVEDAVVTASIVSPTGHYVAQNVTCPYSSGAYVLSVLPAWSTGVLGEAVQGVFLVDVTVNRFEKRRSKVLKYLVTFKTK